MNHVLRNILRSIINSQYDYIRQLEEENEKLRQLVKTCQAKDYMS